MLNLVVHIVTHQALNGLNYNCYSFYIHVTVHRNRFIFK